MLQKEEYDPPTAVAAQPDWFMLFGWFKEDDGEMVLMTGRPDEKLRDRLLTATVDEVELRREPIIAWRIQFQQMKKIEGGALSAWHNEPESVSPILVHDLTDGDRNDWVWLSPILQKPDGSLVIYDGECSEQEAKQRFLAQWISRLR